MGSNSTLKACILVGVAACSGATQSRNDTDSAARLDETVEDVPVQGELAQDGTPRDGLSVETSDQGFAPETPVAQDPVFERGQILPPDSLACLDFETGKEQLDCNHHGSSVDVTQDGTVLAVWYHGMGEKSPDSRIVWSRRPKGGDWTAVEVLFDDPEHGEGNPVIWVAESGELFLFFVTVLGESWNDCEVRLVRSQDAGASWSDVTVLRQEWHWMTRNHPISLWTGELLLPCYDESLYSPAFMISTDDFGQDWFEVPQGEDAAFLLDHLSSIQPSVIERSDGSVFALMRNTGSVKYPFALEMTSTDFGRTWSPSAPGPVPNDGTGIEMRRLSSGRIALAFNNTFEGRYPLSLALSDDEGASWSAVADLDGPCETGDCSHGYTSLAQDPTDDSVWVTFTDERRTIGWVHFNEAWLLAQSGALVSPP